MPQFEIGAIVTLKSGSPAMTIVGEGLSRSYCHAWEVTWFEQQLSGMTGAHASIEENLHEIGARLGVVQAEIQPPPAPAKRIEDEDVPF